MAESSLPPSEDQIQMLETPANGDGEAHEELGASMIKSRKGAKSITKPTFNSDGFKPVKNGNKNDPFKPEPSEGFQPNPGFTNPGFTSPGFTQPGFQPDPGFNQGGFTRVGRPVSHGFRRSGSYRFVHRHEEHSEHETRTGRHISSLVEYISEASREASFLKESWAELITERESIYHEREEWYVRFDELNDFACRLQDENRRYKSEVIEKEVRIEKLLLELSAVKEDLYSEQKKVTEREQDIERYRRELKDSEEKHTRRYKHMERERDEAIHKHSHLSIEIRELKEKNSRLQKEVTAITESRNKLRRDFEQLQYDCENHHHHHHDGGFEGGYTELDLENKRLRSLLRDARKDKERAVSARTVADRERDEANRRYEDKSRQWDRIGDSWRSPPHSHIPRPHPVGGPVRIMSNTAADETIANSEPLRIASQAGTVLNHGDEANQSNGVEEHAAINGVDEVDGVKGDVGHEGEIDIPKDMENGADQENDASKAVDATSTNPAVDVQA